jgi:hypothetical protein
MPVSSFGYELSLKFIVVEARIEARLSILDARASFTRASCFDTSVVTVKRISFDPKRNGPRNHNLNRNFNPLHPPLN